MLIIFYIDSSTDLKLYLKTKQRCLFKLTRFDDEIKISARRLFIILHQFCVITVLELAIIKYEFT